MSAFLNFLFIIFTEGKTFAVRRISFFYSQLQEYFKCDITGTMINKATFQKPVRTGNRISYNDQQQNKLKHETPQRHDVTVASKGHILFYLFFFFHLRLSCNFPATFLRLSCDVHCYFLATLAATLLRTKSQESSKSQLSRKKVAAKSQESSRKVARK